VPESKERLVHAAIETPAQTRHKYAFEPTYGIMLLEHTLAEGLAWPYDYGFVPQKLAGDGDPTDVLVWGEAAAFSGSLVEARISGAIFSRGSTAQRCRAMLSRTERRSEGDAGRHRAISRRVFGG
jgi:inorganic pyrophosphatase